VKAAALIALMDELFVSTKCSLLRSALTEPQRRPR
jgi:hypothetical protein